jgi:hypothetical protein
VGNGAIGQGQSGTEFRSKRYTIELEAVDDLLTFYNSAMPKTGWHRVAFIPESGKRPITALLGAGCSRWARHGRYIDIDVSGGVAGLTLDIISSAPGQPLPCLARLP